MALLADAIGKHALQGKATFTDETPVNMLAPVTGKTKTGRLWVYARDERPWGSNVPPAAWYRFWEDRRGAHPKEHLNKYKGWMHADGYAGYEELYRDHGIKEVACMAHIVISPWMCIVLRVPPSPKKRSCGSANSMPLRRRREVRRQISVSPSGRPRPNPSLTACRID